jgi:hypothetical protein
MLREQVINFLETAVVMLLLTNAFSVLAAAYAISLAQGLKPSDADVPAHPRLFRLLARRTRINP